MLRLTSRLASLAASLALLLPAGGTGQADVSPGGFARSFVTTTAQPSAKESRSATGWWGGAYTASTGERVQVYLSDAYPLDHARAQHWADFLAGLVHGPELSRLTAHFAPLDVVRSLCGEWAGGCYSPLDHTLLAPGESSAGVSAEAVVMHEYGHHVANNRANPPWRAVDWGPKRWASNARICPRRRAGTAFPTGGDRYRLHPGEAFAEAYRVLNETRAGRTDFDWFVVDGSFRPDATALRLVYEDVVRPWAPARRQIAGRFGARGPSVYETLLATPYDGSLAVALAGPARYRLLVADPFTGRVLAQGRRVERTVCGERSLLLRVVGDGSAGRFSLRIMRP